MVNLWLNLWVVSLPEGTFTKIPTGPETSLGGSKESERLHHRLSTVGWSEKSTQHQLMMFVVFINTIYIYIYCIYIYMYYIYNYITNNSSIC